MEEEGPGRWVGRLLGPWGASLTNGTSYASRIMHSVGFFDVGYVKTFEIEHYDSSGGPIIRKLWRKMDRGGGWADC